MPAARTPRIVALAAALALPLALLSATPATAATVGVATWADLRAAFLVDGDTVRLDANITGVANEPLLIEAGENIILDLNGFTLSITNPGTDNAAISVPATASLTINATNGGTLTATGGYSGAGIGGDEGSASGTITINRGIINARGGFNAAGIGGGDGVGGNGGTTILNGGTITARGGPNSVGIGGGFSRLPGVLHVNGTPDAGAATDGGGSGSSVAAITNPTTPPGVGYSATSSSSLGSGTLVVRFNYLVTFDTNGGSADPADQTINDGDSLTTPAAPTREGFEFAGWTSGGSTYDFATPITAPLTLSAAWTAVLAATGTDVTSALGLGALLIASGVILIALRRLVAKHSA